MYNCCRKVLVFDREPVWKTVGGRCCFVIGSQSGVLLQEDFFFVIWIQCGDLLQECFVL